MRRKWYVVWHQDNPGARVWVLRRMAPRSPFSRVGEPILHYNALTWGYPYGGDYTDFWNDELADER